MPMRNDETVTFRRSEYTAPDFGIDRVALEFDLDAELKIWISGSPMPVQKQFNKNLNIYEVQSVLAGYVLG